MPEEPQQGQSETQGQETEQLDFDAWLGSQDEKVRALLDNHTKGLRSALEGERSQRKELAKQLKELTGKVEANSDAAKQLAEISGRLELEEKRADFYEKASTAGCRNLRLAWLAAQADNLTVEQVKAQHPELFGTSKPDTGAGHGAGSGGGGETKDMNAFIRRAAGR